MSGRRTTPIPTTAGTSPDDGRSATQLQLRCNYLRFRTPGCAYLHQLALIAPEKKLPADQPHTSEFANSVASCSSFTKPEISAQKHPRVKMRRLTISNLLREKWYSTIFRRRATTHLESVGGCRSNGKSRLLTVAFFSGVRRQLRRRPVGSINHQPSTINHQPSTINQQYLSTIPASLQVIPSEYHLLQPPLFLPRTAGSFIQNRTTLSTIISNSE